MGLRTEKGLVPGRGFAMSLKWSFVSGVYEEAVLYLSLICPSFLGVASGFEVDSTF